VPARRSVDHAHIFEHNDRRVDLYKRLERGRNLRLATAPHNKPASAIELRFIVASRIPGMGKELPLSV